jgi:hypothetical protein
VLLKLDAREGVPKHKDFHDQDLPGAIFDGLNLQGACFDDLSGADFRTSDLSHASFYDAVYDATTKFPETFKPLDCGLVHAEKRSQ